MHFLLIGGTGIVGLGITETLVRRGHQVTALGVDANPLLPPEVRQVILDRNINDFDERLAQVIDISRIQAVVDIYCMHVDHARQTHSIFPSVPVFVLSTALVYDRSEQLSTVISEDHPRASPSTLGSYVDSKIAIEEFWEFTKGRYVLLRPYHILGPLSLLGCLPLHNRDPELLSTLRSGRALRLVHGGEVELQHINTHDIGGAILAIADSGVFRQAFNLVHPETFSARSYFEAIAHQLGVALAIEDVSVKEAWGEGWELTMLPHRYSGRLLQRLTGFSPGTAVDESISQALRYIEHAQARRNALQVHERMNKGVPPQRPSWY